MPNDEKKRRRAARRNRLLLSLLFSLLPMFVVAGVFAPGFVNVKPVENEEIEGISVRVSRSLSRFARQPLLVPRDLTSGFVPEVLDLDHLFSGSNLLAGGGIEQPPAPASFPHSSGEKIVLDDANQRLREIVFKDPVLMAHASTQTWPPPAKDITPLGGADPVGDGPRFDDFLGPDFNPDDVVVVPESSSGALLGLGLVLLAVVSRRRDLAAAR